MSKRKWRLFVENGLEFIELIEDCVKGMNFDEFKKDRKTVDAVVRNFEIIGEASRNIPEEIRNRIVHEYFGVSGNELNENNVSQYLIVSFYHASC